MTDTVTDETEIQAAVYSLAVASDFARSGVCFAADNDGLRRSDDRGRTWHSVFDSMGFTMRLPATNVALFPRVHAPDILVAGVPGGLLRSEDGGATWTSTILPSPPPFVSALAASPAFDQDGIMFAGTMEDGVFRSGDRGGRWDIWNIGLLDLRIFCLAVSPGFAHDRTVFAGTESGIYWSKNSGHFWNDLPFFDAAAPVLSLAVSPTFSQDGILFAGTEANGLFRSEDRGQSWQRLEGLELSGAVNAIYLSASFPAQPHILLLLDDALLVSRDGGASWSDWETTADLSAGVSAVIPPQGLDLNGSLLVGLFDGQVLEV